MKMIIEIGRATNHKNTVMAPMSRAGGRPLQSGPPQAAGQAGGRRLNVPGDATVPWHMAAIRPYCLIKSRSLSPSRTVP
jgi:hypothetical protein